MGTQQEYQLEPMTWKQCPLCKWKGKTNLTCCYRRSDHGERPRLIELE